MSPKQLDSGEKSNIILSQEADPTFIKLAREKWQLESSKIELSSS